MGTAHIIFKFILFALPSIALVVAVYIFTNKWYEIQKAKLKLGNIKSKNSGGVVTGEKGSIKKHFFPLQVDATQRMVLFLERISPNNLIMRLNNPGLPARAFQQKLLENIRSEYEHNLAQQIFISSEAWNITKQSKEEVVKIINMAGTKVNDTALANDLSRAVLEITAQLEKQPTDIAINYLKAELNNSLNNS